MDRSLLLTRRAIGFQLSFRSSGRRRDANAASSLLLYASPANEQPFRAEPSEKYAPYVPINLAQRQWPNRTINSPPTWVSTDLRDGNQALATPMSVEQKVGLFQHLVACGIQEIEVGFPSASATEFFFLRTLIESGHIPENVWIQVHFSLHRIMG
jgi:hypothetical protein